MIDNFDIREIDWGNDSAEHDPELLNYFVTPQHFSRIKDFKKTFIIGRKGSGKTAIRRKVANEFAGDNNHILIDVSPTNGIFRNLAGVELLKEELGTVERIRKTSAIAPTPSSKPQPLHR